MSNHVKEVIEKYRAKTASAAQEAKKEEPVKEAVKTASEAGFQDAENMMKVAAALGDVISERIISNIQEFFGGNPEKTASFQELLADSLVKAADMVSGTAGVREVAADQAESLQIDETAVNHATLAAQAATDAISSMQQGDEHSATQQMRTAASALATAKEVASRSQNPAVHQHISAASQIVAQVAGAAAGE